MVKCYKTKTTTPADSPRLLSPQQEVPGGSPRLSLRICVSFGKSNHFSKFNQQKLAKDFIHIFMHMQLCAQAQYHNNRDASLTLNLLVFIFALWFYIRQIFLFVCFLGSIHVAAPITSLVRSCCHHDLVEYTAF